MVAQILGHQARLSIAPVGLLLERLHTDCGEPARHPHVAATRVRRLAELADVSNPYLSQIERGLRKPSAEILQQVAQALKISVETLYIKAGILPDDDRTVSTVAEAIQADEQLTDDQKRALLNVYQSFLAS